MKKTWAEVVYPVLASMPLPKTMDGLVLPTKSNVAEHKYLPEFLHADAMVALLRGEHKEDVLAGFDSTGKSFIGWWPSPNHACIDSRKLWLMERGAHAFVSHDFNAAMSWPYTIGRVLSEFPLDRFAFVVKVAVEQGVHLGTPDVPETADRIRRHFEIDNIFVKMRPKNPAYLRQVLGYVLLAPAENLHWKFEGAEGTEAAEHAWATSTMLWFETELKRKLDRASEGASREAGAGAGSGAGAGVEVSPSKRVKLI